MARYRLDTSYREIQYREIQGDIAEPAARCGGAALRVVRFNPRLPGELALSALGGEQRGVELLRGAWLGVGPRLGSGLGLGLGLELELGLKLQLGLGLGLRLRLGSGFERPCACGSARA